MNRFKKVLGYILGFSGSILLVILVFLIVLKFTIFNQEYVLKVLYSNNYYESVYKDINKDFSNSLRSSGLDDSVIDGIYSLSDAEVDINNFVASMYSGSKYEVNSDGIKNKLNDNIDKYLKEHSFEVDRDSLNKYVDGIVSIYENQIEFYGYLDGFVKEFTSVQKYINLFIVIILVLFIINYIVLRYVIYEKYSGVIVLSSGFMLIYLKYFVYDCIDFKNIVIISDNFSNVIRNVFNDIGNYIMVFAIICLIISLFLNIYSSMKKVKRIKRS